MQAELIEWQKKITQYALKSKCGAAMGDECLTLETARLGGAATAASQLWGIIMETLQHSKTIELEVEALRAAQPEYYLNGNWLLDQLIQRLPLQPPTDHGRRLAREALHAFLLRKLPLHGSTSLPNAWTWPRRPNRRRR